MGSFNYNSFADTAQIFNQKGGSRPGWRRYLNAPQQKSFLGGKAPHSRFMDFNGLIFARVVLPVQRDKKISTRGIEASQFYRPMIPMIDVAIETKVRPTLKLKSKVELPFVIGVSRRSTVTDFAAAFKAELRTAEKEPAQFLAQSLTTVQTSRPSTQKTWAELATEAQAVFERPRNTLDLAAAFKQEMQTVLAQQQGHQGPQSTNKRPISLPSLRRAA